jgi:hypothetical protein
MMAMCHRLLLWCCNKEGDNNLLPLPFFMFEKKKTMTMCHHFFLGGVVAKKATITYCHRFLLCVRAK